MPAKEHQEMVRVEGIVLETLPGLLFRVQAGDEIILAHLGGKMRIHRIRVIPGDRVAVEMVAYDRTRGRITRRL